ncbi:polyprenyl synthetase family protein [Chlamydia sp.]|uniref:polyprenyl synthetase family protein n=1 Tax=Chlamydia sp. TaxID=35827 RepID=UPI0025BE57B9|nr:polyprenyl synthetase family protein [Chlamydia sp.]MBQ8498877.1 polyprenyl synthetase family protein [Chlamydia sp.]
MDYFSVYRSKVEKKLRDSLEDFGKSQSGLREPIEYALLGGGKRIRPLLVCLFADGVRKERDVLDTAIAIEYIHTSTLIADDLPCMDDDDLRRGKPSVHKAFDEASALLASYALIPAAYARIHKNAKILKEKVSFKQEIEDAYEDILKLIELRFGAGGILGGQYEDVFSQDFSEESVLGIIKKKTGALFEIACVAGWLFGGGNRGSVSLVSDFAEHFGVLFQLCDDLADLDQDNKDKKHLNYALLFGKSAAIDLVDQSFHFCIKNLNLLKKEGLRFLDPLEFLCKNVLCRFH